MGIEVGEKILASGSGFAVKLSQSLKIEAPPCTVEKRFLTWNNEYHPHPNLPIINFIYHTFEIR